MAQETITISPVNVEDRQKIGIRTGDAVRVWQKVEEKGKIRLQPFEGTVLARKHGNEAGATFTVRRVSGGYGVEKIFPLYSPSIDKIEIVKRARLRSATLYHIRDKATREIKRQMRNMRFVDISTVSDISEQAAAEADTSTNENETLVTETKDKETANEKAEIQNSTEEIEVAKESTSDSSSDQKE